eukprot:1138535-Pelagomonas_calceolata.AAC.5
MNKSSTQHALTFRQGSANANQGQDGHTPPSPTLNTLTDAPEPPSARHTHSNSLSFFRSSRAAASCLAMAFLMSTTSSARSRKKRSASEVICAHNSRKAAGPKVQTHQGWGAFAKSPQKFGGQLRLQEATAVSSALSTPVMQGIEIQYRLPPNRKTGVS